MKSIKRRLRLDKILYSQSAQRKQFRKNIDEPARSSYPVGKPPTLWPDPDYRLDKKPCRVVFFVAKSVRRLNFPVGGAVK